MELGVASLVPPQQVARAIPRYLDEETWENAAAGLIQNVYFRESEEARLKLISHPAHVESKSKQARWLDGYRVVIAKVIREYGDGRLVRSAGVIESAPACVHGASDARAVT